MPIPTAFADIPFHLRHLAQKWMDEGKSLAWIKDALKGEQAGWESLRAVEPSPVATPTPAGPPPSPVAPAGPAGAPPAAPKGPGLLGRLARMPVGPLGTVVGGALALPYVKSLADAGYNALPEETRNATSDWIGKNVFRDPMLQEGLNVNPATPGETSSFDVASEFNQVTKPVRNILDLFFGPEGAKVPPPAAATAPAPGLDIASILGLGQGGQGFGTVSAPLPQGPDYAALRAQFPNAKTLASPEYGRQAMIDDMLGGLAAGLASASESAPLGTLLLKAGAGMLAGQSAGARRNREALERINEKNVGIDNEAAMRLFGLDTKIAEAKAAQERDVFHALQPKAEGGIVRQGKLSPDGKNITWSMERIKSPYDSILPFITANQAGLVAKNPKSIQESLFTTPEGAAAVIAAKEALSGKGSKDPRFQTPEIKRLRDTYARAAMEHGAASDALRTQLELSFIRQFFGKEYNAAQQDAANRAVLSGAITGLRGF